MESTAVLNQRKRPAIILALIVLGGLLLRLLAVQFPANYDFYSFIIQGDIAIDFGNIYARTPRYNYGPIYYCIMGVLRFLALSTGGANADAVFRYLLLLFLTSIDIGLMLYVLKKSKSLGLAAVFFLNPVAVVITGCHHQFDNLAILLALLAFQYFSEEAVGFGKRDVLFILLFSIGLIVKHIFIFFVLWIFVRPKLSLRKRMAYTIVPIFLFVLSFVPFLLTGGTEGIMTNVFRYRSYNNAPLLLRFYQLFSIPEKYYRVVFVLALCFLGFCFRKRDIQQTVLLYTIAMVAFSSAIANQYLAIPMVALVLLTRFSKYIYFFIMGFYLLLENNGLGLWNRYASGLAQGDITPVHGLVESFLNPRGYEIAAILLFLSLLKYTGLFSEKIKKLI